MATHPPTQEEKGKKQFYKISFLILAAAVVGLTWRQSYIDDKGKQQLSSSNSNQMFNLQTRLSTLQTNFDNYRAANEHPVPSLPWIEIETLNGMPEGFTNDPHLRLNRLSVQNFDVEIDNVCSRLQLPEPICTTIETNEPVGTFVGWRSLMNRIVVNGTGGRSWVGGGSTVTWLDSNPCFFSTNLMGEKLSISKTGDTSGIWELTIDKLPPRGRVSVLFITSDDEQAANYIKLASVPAWQGIPQNPKARPDTNELDFFLAGNYQFQAASKPANQFFLVPILFDAEHRKISSLNTQPDIDHWRPCFMMFQ